VSQTKYCCSFKFKIFDPKNFGLPTLLLRIGPDCEKLKSTCDNLGAVYSSDVNGKKLHEKILDCKMLLSRRAT